MGKSERIIERRPNKMNWFWRWLHDLASRHIKIETTIHLDANTYAELASAVIEKWNENYRKETKNAIL